MKKSEVRYLLDKPYPDIVPIRDEDREKSRKLSEHYRGSVRLATGHFVTDKEYKERRKVLKKPLP